MSSSAQSGAVSAAVVQCLVLDAYLVQKCLEPSCQEEVHDVNQL